MRIMELDERWDELKPYIQTLEKEGLPNNPSSFSHWQRYQDGILYTSGAWAEQPKWYVEDMHYVSLVMELWEIPTLLQHYQKIISDVTGQGQ